MNNIRARPVGVVAAIDADGVATVSAASGASATLAYSPSMPGLNPLELLDASLAGCLAISLRMAARQLGLADRLGAVRVEVIGVKAPEPPSRIATQLCRFDIGGDFTAEEKTALRAQAHALCTIGHTLESHVEIVDDDVKVGADRS
jgi:uncharacterized OsmC-like protein